MLQNAAGETAHHAGRAPTPFELERGTSIFDLALHFQEHSGGLLGFVEYSSESFDASTIDRFVGHSARTSRALSRT